MQTAIGPEACQPKKRFGLAVLNYVVTSNHVHMLVKDSGTNDAAASSNRSIAALRSNRL
jgi:REP-associated tyrosine transposase